jgi:hypothetical protein
MLSAKIPLIFFLSLIIYGTVDASVINVLYPSVVLVWVKERRKQTLEFQITFGITRSFFIHADAYVMLITDSTL